MQLTKKIALKHEDRKLNAGEFLSRDAMLCINAVFAV